MKNIYENMSIDELKKEYYKSTYTLIEKLAIAKAIKNLSQQNIMSLNEMAYNRREFYSMCVQLFEQIHFNIINIIILGDYFPENINHWKNELFGYVKNIFYQTTEKSVKKADIVKKCIIEVWCDQFTFEYDTDEPIIAAIKDEIKKGTKNPANKYIVQIMKDDILPYASELLDNYNKDFSKIFTSLYNTFKQKDFNIFRNTIECYCID